MVTLKKQVWDKGQNYNHLQKCVLISIVFMMYIQNKEMSEQLDVYLDRIQEVRYIYIVYICYIDQQLYSSVYQPLYYMCDTT